MSNENENKPVTNDERHFMIHGESLRLYSKMVFLSECPDRVGKNIGNNSALGDPATGLRIILSEIAQSLLQINVWNAEIAGSGEKNKESDIPKTVITCQQ